MGVALTPVVADLSLALTSRLTMSITFSMFQALVDNSLFTASRISGGSFERKIEMSIDPYELVGTPSVRRQRTCVSTES